MAEHDGRWAQSMRQRRRMRWAAAYDLWAEGYDAKWRRQAIATRPSGWRFWHAICRRGRAAAGCGVGTGLAGPWFGIVGYPEVWGWTYPRGCWLWPARKGCYARLSRAVLGEPLAFADGQFAAVISTGVFTTGHVGAEALPELVRITAQGGVIVLTVKGTLWEGGFAAVLQALPLDVLEVTEPYVSMPGEAATTPSRAVALRVR